MGGVTVATLVALGLVSYDEIHNVGHTMPCPGRFLYVVAIFGAIGLLGSKYPRFAAAVAWALLLGLLLEAVSPPDEGGLGRPITNVVGAVTRRPANHPKAPTHGGGHKK